MNLFCRNSTIRRRITDGFLMTTQVMGRSAIFMLRKVHNTNCFFLRTVSIRYLTTPTPESATSVKGTLGNYDLNHPECNTPLNIASRIGTNLHHNNRHPLGIIKNIIENYWNEKENQENPSGAGFTCVDSLSPIVSTTANFDSLLIPSDHVSRSRSDTYYLRNDTVLRTHTSAHQVELLSKPYCYDKFLVTGDVYRRDEIDKSHYPIFHQMEGVKVFSSIDDIKVVEDDLKIGLEGMARTLFGDVEMRWVPAYFPFTEPSYELEIHFQGEWLEVLGCGIIQPGILRNAGRSEKDVGWAFGLGLERLAMVLFDIPDIRLFWSKDERFSKQFLPGNIVKFIPYSKYPPCFKDITFWVPPEFHPNDLNELVRGIAGDLVEKIQLMDEFTHPKTQRLSNCFRITYRSMDRSLTNEEIDDLQWKVREAVIEKLGAELR